MNDNCLEDLLVEKTVNELENASSDTNDKSWPSKSFCDKQVVTNPLISLFPCSVNNSKSISSDFLQSDHRKSAFQPYRQVAPCTLLTNLQRGNTQAETSSIPLTDINTFTLAGRGEISQEDVINEKNLNIVDKDGFTRLHWAAAFGQYNAVQLLLDNGEDINMLGKNEESALHIAANGGHHEVIRLLISKGIDVNHTDHLLNTALMYAAKGNHPHSCNELLLGGADFRMTNFNDETALTIALKNSCHLAQLVIQKHILMQLDF